MTHRVEISRGIEDLLQSQRSIARVDAQSKFGQTMISEADQRAIVARIGTGDRGAFEEFYRAYERLLYRFILSKLNDPHEAADILHDVFMEIWRAADRFEGRSKVQTWLFGIAWRKVIDRLRKHGRITVTDDLPDVADDSPDAAACLVAGQEAAHVRHCLGELKEDHRMAVTLAFYEDMSYGQIAEIAGVPEGTIKTRVFHAKKLLLRCLSVAIGPRAAS